MADIRPFKGVRYAIESPDQLGAYVVPPYDMLDKAMVDELYNKSKYNAVRITQNRPEPSDTHNKDRHFRAASELETWLEERVLVADVEPSIYVYEQEFIIDKDGAPAKFTRTGIITNVRLVDFNEGVVQPHEYTLSGPKQDRYELLDITRVDTGLIFGLVPDTGDFHATIVGSRTNEPVGKFTDMNGVVHSLYRCVDKNIIEKLVSMMKQRTILIADGHHRYETALKFYRDQGQDAYAYTMMALVSMADPGLVIRPFHRLILKQPNEPTLNPQTLSKFFDITDLGTATPDLVFKHLSDADYDKSIYVDSSSKHAYTLVLNEAGEEQLRKSVPEHSEVWAHLDVSKINVLMVNTLLGRPLDGHVLHDTVEYTQDVPSAINKLTTSNDFYGGIFIRPVTIDTVQKIVSGGERMPQKSTNFYPKLYSGLVFYKMDS